MGVGFKVVVSLSLSFFTLISVSSDAGNIYRFKINGRTVMKDHVPPEYTRLGYDVLNSSGMLIKHVKPAPSAEELKRKKAAEEAEKKRQVRIEKHRKNDAKLLRLYAKPEDVRRAQKRKADEVNNYIRLEQRRIDDTKKKLEDAQQHAQNIKAGNGNISKGLQDEITQLESALRDGQRSMQARQQEMADNQLQFDRDYQRVRILQVYEPGVLVEDVDFKRIEKALGKP